MELKRSILLVVLVATACATSPGAVATPEPHSAEEASYILARGNAVDAAVCIGFVIAVTHPYAGNLGGGGFMVVHFEGRDYVVDARETAPAAATADMYLGKDGEPVTEASLVGPLAAGVPGSVAGYLALHKRFGRLDLTTVLEPAIHLAREGFKVDAGLAAAIEGSKDLLARFPETAAIFLPEGSPLRAGQVLRQPDLADVLDAIAWEGRDGFYEGRFPAAVEAANRKHGGRMTAADLAAYEPVWRKPLRGSYKGYDVLTMPPPSSGGVVLLQMLAMLERGGYAGLEPQQRKHLFAEVSRRAFADRAVHFGDPGFVDVPIADMLDPAYLDKRFEGISMAMATPSADVEAGRFGADESEETCHFSVVDGEGNAVACTTTLNGRFGCGLVVHGVLLNNEMDDFTAKPGVPNQFGLIQGEKNAVGPGRRPLSSMTPTIVLKDGQPVLVLGSPGGPTIISSVCQVLTAHLGLGMPLAGAVAAPRIHHQWQPDRILAEPLGASEIRYLKSLGHEVKTHDRPIGDVQAIGVRKGAWQPVSDPRGRGAVGGG
ncbi:MAG: gamma-glutamyltransferase [Planctomycetota bacterium]|jgi:gamma-glutamyltranspeptidase/glutathione hydrolase